MFWGVPASPTKTMIIENKTEMQVLYARGEFGNRFSIYTLDQVRRGEVEYPIGLMYRGRGQTRPPGYAKPLGSAQEIEDMIDLWVSLGLNRDRILIYESSKGRDKVCIFQGEVARTEHYYWLRWTDIDEPMSMAFAKYPSNYAVGLQAYGLLKHYMDNASWENLQSLWDRYPDAVVEFSVFARPLGVLGWNTVFWEVRNY